MPESLATRLQRHAFNLFPPYFGTGARITHIASDWREVRIALPLSVRTRNYVGTIFGGSMFAAVDPLHVVMLLKNLGKGFVVWDKSASIRYLRPGRATLSAAVRLEDGEMEEIRAALLAARSVERTYTIDLVDPDGRPCARVEKVVYVGRHRARDPRA
jgi:acyl-coenzyme A thioesterase PaaI-like protein